MRPTLFSAVAVLSLLSACSGSDSDETSVELDGGNEDASVDGWKEPDVSDAGDGNDTMDAGSDTGVAAPEDSGLDGSSSPEADAGSDAAVSTPVFNFDFENTLPTGLEPGTGLLVPSQGYETYGPSGNTFGPQFLQSATGNTITLTVDDLPAHTSLSLSFLFAAIDSLDGTGNYPAGDFFKVTLDGATVFRESFSNAQISDIQSYDTPTPPEGVVLARRIDLGFSGPGGYYTDSAYNFALEPRFKDLPHGSSSAVITFTLEGAGVQSLTDESWAIDNVNVLVGFTPRERADAGTP